MQFYNVHSHVFTMNNAPKRFLDLYMPKIATDAVNAITNTKVGLWAIRGILNIIPWQPGKRYASFLSIGKSKSQLQVFEDLMAQYKDDSDIKFVALTLNMEMLGAGISNSGFEGQIEEAIEIKRKYPDRVLLFFSVDPRWKQTGTEIQQTLQKYFEMKIQVNAIRSVYPFAGIKLYPSTGFFVFDAKLMETFAWAEQNAIPVLSHCNYMGGIYNNDINFLKTNLFQTDPYTAAVYPVPQLSSKIKNQEACSYFLEPSGYRSVLTKFPKLKLCLAHYGGDGHILANHGIQKLKSEPLFSINPDDWCTQIKKMMVEFPNLYTDISYAIHNSKIHQPVFEDLKTSDLQNRIMYGTDFFMTERELPEKDDYTIFKQNASKVALANGNNAWQQMASINTATFLNSKYV